MKVHLMHGDRDFDADLAPGPGHEQVEGDLGIGLLLEAMAGGDPLVWTVSRAAIAAPLADTEEVVQRQRVLADVLENEADIRSMYSLANEGVEANRHIHVGVFSSRPGPMLSRARANLVEYVAVLRRLRLLVEDTTPRLRSPWLLRLARTLAEELSENYLSEVESTLKVLRFPHGSHQSARLGLINSGVDYVLREPPQGTWLQGLLMHSRFWGRHVITIPERDMGGFETLNALKDQGQATAADALGAGRRPRARLLPCPAA